MRSEFMIGGLSIFVLVVTFYLFSQMDSVKKNLETTQQYNKQNREDLIKLNNLIQLQLRESFGDDETEGETDDDEYSEYDNEEEFTDEDSIDDEGSETDEDTIDEDTIDEGPVVSKNKGKKGKRKLMFTILSSNSTSNPLIIKNTPKIQEIADDNKSYMSNTDTSEDNASEDNASEDNASELEENIDTDSNVENKDNEDNEDTNHVDDTVKPESQTDESCSEFSKCSVEVRQGKRKLIRPCGKPLIEESEYCKTHSKKTLKLAK